MKVGLIGNMNNNNFSLMRYFRDLGADAHLLLYKDDGQGTLSHFRPECDTWEFDRWRPYIHQTSIPNSPVAALGWPAGTIMSLWSWLRYCQGRQDSWTAWVSTNEVGRSYADYDRLIGSGSTPAVLTRSRRSLDVFYPYAIGVEYLSTTEFTDHFSQSGPVKKALYKSVATRQAEGIRAARTIINSDPGVTDEALRGVGVRPVNMAIPMVYNRGGGPAGAPGGVVSESIERIKGSDLPILHHARLMWSDSASDPDSKNNHWLLIALARLIAARPDANPLLLIVEYGPDVDATRRLAAELGIERYVHWLPKMQRRELTLLMSHVSIVCGEFYRHARTTWGGTGWEAFASGKPLLQGFNFEPDEFHRLFGHPAPPMLPVRVPEDVEAHLLESLDRPDLLRMIGQGALDWFDRHNGIGLARRWLDALHIEA